MRDGSRKPINSIQIGERVLGDNERLTVIDVFRGRESELVRLETEEGAVLCATAEHPVATPTGPVLAGELAVGDAVATPTGGSAIVRACSVEHGEFDTANLAFETPNFFYVDGFVAGDSKSEGMMFRQRDEAREADNNAQLPELERLRQSLDAR